MASPSTSTTQIQETKGLWRKFRQLMKTDVANDGEWLKVMRGNLSLVATVIATMTFQMGLNPPGGVVQTWDNGFVGCKGQYAYDHHACPGKSVYSAVYQYAFFLFMFFDSISFFSSLVVCLWLVSGLPLNYLGYQITLPLAIFMCISVCSLAPTFVLGVYMIAPVDVWIHHNPPGVVANYVSFMVCCIVVLIMGALLVMRFFWLVSIRGKGHKASPTPSVET